MLKQQDFQTGWELCKDVKVAGIDGQLTKGLQTKKLFQDDNISEESKIMVTKVWLQNEKNLLQKKISINL